MSRALGVPTTSTQPRPEPGTVYVKVERRVGLCIIATSYGRSRMPIIRQVPIHSTGLHIPR